MTIFNFRQQKHPPSYALISFFVQQMTSIKYQQNDIMTTEYLENSCDAIRKKLNGRQNRFFLQIPSPAAQNQAKRAYKVINFPRGMPGMAQPIRLSFCPNPPFNGTSVTRI
jgi:hypothetical protein